MKLKEKFSYGVGTLGYAMENSLVSGYLVLYATAVQKLSPALFGTVLLIPKLLDILSDLFITSQVDKTKTKYGTYRPYLFSSIPLGILMVLLFCNPAFLQTSTQKLVWIALIFFFMVTVFETLYWCPYATLSGVMSGDASERISLSSWRSAFESISGLIVAAITIPLVTKIGASYTNPTGWKYAAILFATIGVISMLVCFFGVKERTDIPPQKENIPLKLKIAVLLNNRKLIKITAIMSLLFFPWYGYSTLFSYFCIHNLGHEEWIAPLSIIGITISVAVTFIVPAIAGKLGKTNTIIVGVISILIAMAVMSFANSFFVMIIVFLLKDLGQISIYICSFSFVPEISDEISEKTGMNSAGIVMGCVSSFQKLAAAIGTYFATLVLSLGKYNADLVIQSQWTQNHIRFGIVLLYSVPVICMLAIAKTIKEA